MLHQTTPGDRPRPRRHGAALPLAALTLLLAAPVAAQAPPDRASVNGVGQTVSTGNRVSLFAGDIHIPADARQRGSVVCLGGDVVIDGQVDQDVVVIGGRLRLTGEVDGQVVGVFSGMELEGADIGVNVVNVGGTLAMDDTRVAGQTADLGLGDWLPGFPSALGLLGAIIFWFRLLGLVLAFLVVVLLIVVSPERVRLIAEEAPVRYGTAWFVGLLVYVLFGLLVLPLAAATLIGLPVVVAMFVVFKWLGIAGLMLAVGERLGRGMGRRMSPLGAVMLVFVPLALLRLIPLLLGPVGLVASMLAALLIWVFFEVPAVGLALLTRAGTRGGPVAPAVGPTGTPHVAVTEADSD